MTRAIVAMFLVGVGIGAATEPMAQGSGKIPVEQDVRRAGRIERRIEGTEANPTNPAVPAVPGGVVGFSGPSGFIGDSVDSYGPLPQGAAGADIR